MSLALCDGAERRAPAAKPVLGALSGGPGLQDELASLVAALMGWGGGHVRGGRSGRAWTWGLAREPAGTGLGFGPWKRPELER